MNILIGSTSHMADVQAIPVPSLAEHAVERINIQLRARIVALRHVRAEAAAKSRSGTSRH